MSAETPLQTVEIEAAIRTAVPDAEVRVESEDGTHYTAFVTSASFEGLPLVRQHQAVMKALRDDFDSERLHALQLKTFTPQAWQTFLSKRESPLSVV